MRMRGPHALLVLACCLGWLDGARAFSGGRPALLATRRRAAPVAPRERVAVAAAPRARLVLSSAAASPGGDSKWYRTLGISPDATYDEITEAFTELVEAAGSDDTRIATLERARDMILDARLKMRLSGQGQTVRDPTIRPKEKRDWFAPLRVLGKYIELPDREHTRKVTTLFGIFAAVALISDGIGNQLGIFSILFAPGFIYARGQPDVPGEIRPTKTGPMLKAFGITLFFTGALYALGLFYLSIVIPPSVLPTKMLCNVMITLGAWFSAMFFRTQLD